MQVKNYNNVSEIVTVVNIETTGNESESECNEGIRN